MNIQLLQTKIDKLHFESINTEDDSNENSFNLSFDVEFRENNNFVIIFKINIIHPNEFNLSFIFKSLFETNIDITDKFKKSPFPYVNAPAIAFPFIRTFVSNFTLNAGYKPVILPSINFTKIKNKRE